MSSKLSKLPAASLSLIESARADRAMWRLVMPTRAWRFSYWAGKPSVTWPPCVKTTGAGRNPIHRDSYELESFLQRGGRKLMRSFSVSDRKRVVLGTSWSVRVDSGGRRFLQK